MKRSQRWIILSGIIGLLLVISAYFISGNSLENTDDPSSTRVPTAMEESPTLSEAERQQVDTWIEVNDLNPYGDPEGTIYPGGTPLFDESTATTIDKYTYILKQHPDRPWQD